MDCLKFSGTVAVDKERLMVLVMVGRSMEEHFLRSDVGMGSRSHCLSGDWRSSLETSSIVAGRKEMRSSGEDGGVRSWGEDWLLEVRQECNLMTLSEKKVANECASD